MTIILVINPITFGSSRPVSNFSPDNERKLCHPKKVLYYEASDGISASVDCEDNGSLILDNRKQSLKPIRDYLKSKKFPRPIPSDFLENFFTSFRQFERFSKAIILRSRWKMILPGSEGQKFPFGRQPLK